ncbi:MAG: DUF3987 domain-containing protein [Bacteroidia bacterium]
MEINSIYEIDEKIGRAFKTNKEIAVNQLSEIILKLPTEIRNLIDAAFEHQRIPKEYLLSSILFAFSNAAGLAFSIKSGNYTNYANLYFAIVGLRGDIKSPAMELATAPLHQHDNLNYLEYHKNKIENPSIDHIRRQLFLQDATIESALFVHKKNPYSIGIYVDELFNLVQKMANKNSNEGSAWRTFLLQGNTNKHIDVSRKTTDSYRIEKSYPTLMGSIQNQFIPKLFADGNLESGLIDRFLFTNKLTNNNTLSRQNISEFTISNYAVPLLNLLKHRTDIENTYEMVSVEIVLNEEAQKKMFDYSQDLINKQALHTDYSREYVAKMLINIHKITLLVHLIYNSYKINFSEPVTLKTLELAILINEFYFTNFKIIIEENITQNNKLPRTEDVIKLAIKNNACQKDVVAITGMDKSTISRKWNKELEQHATGN